MILHAFMYNVMNDFSGARGISKGRVNYRKEDEIVNSPHSCTSLKCSIYRASKDGEIDLMRQKKRYRNTI